MKDTRAHAENIESMLMEKNALDVIPVKINELVDEIELSINELS